MSRQRQLQPVRHPLNKLGNDVESWDDDPEFDLQGDEDLFGKLSTLENSLQNFKSTASSSRSSSGKSADSLSFEDRLESLSLNDDDGGLAASFASKAALDDAFDGFSDFGDDDDEDDRNGDKSTIKMSSAAAVSILGTVQQLEPGDSSTLKGSDSSRLIDKQKILSWVEDSEEAGLDFDDTLKPRQQSTDRRPDHGGDIISGSLFEVPISKSTGKPSPKLTQHSSPRPTSSKQKSPKLSTVVESSRQKTPPKSDFDDFESDFVIPDDLSKIELKLSTRPRTPVHLGGDSDIEGGWGEESTSTRYTGSKFTDSSNRSSMISAFSPSSSVTYESEDEGLLGLQIPSGPLNFQQLLDGKMKDVGGDLSKTEADVQNLEHEEFLEGLEIGEDDHIFDTGKWTVNKNIKQKSMGGLSSKTSPKRPTVSQIFAPRPTRIPRPVSQTSNSSPLLQTQSSLSMLKPEAPPIPPTNSTQLRRLGHKASMASIKPSGQNSNQRHGALLSKKSMPSLRTSTSDLGNDRYSLSSAPPLPSLPSRLSSGISSNTASPGIRPAASSSNLRRMTSRSSMIPPSPASLGTPATPSIPPFNRFSRKPSMSSFHSHALSDDSLPGRATVSQSTATTTTTTISSATTKNTPSPRKHYIETEVPDSVRREAPTTKTLLRPVRRRLFGDGTELDEFEDLPISSVKEQTYLKKPSSGGSHSKKSSLSSRGDDTGISHLRDISKTQGRRQTSTQLRKAASSSSIAGSSSIPSAMPKSAKSSNIPPAKTTRQPSSKPRRKQQQQRPHLIRPMGDYANAPRQEKGMRYNPKTFKWEGNDSVTVDFESVVLTPPRPALISNISAKKGIQVVGGMVFDPVRMCWFKASDVMRPSAGSGSPHGSAGEVEFDFDGAAASMEDDPFAGFDDEFDDEDTLKAHEQQQFSASEGTLSKRPLSMGGGNRAASSQLPSSFATGDGGRRKIDTGSVYGEFVVGEEFDVGPGFVRKQMDEEERWRRKVHGWIGRETSEGAGAGQPFSREYLYEIRTLIMGRK
ncbi:hypothetical protein BZA70DRAFT_115222 [Myxozyma melibiosi]|uniref:Cytokinesis regulator n=1 Tax=Myxozyma melibiosi TaxID=54550 RepID=A0ABR1FAN3_9ASCO